MGTLSREMWVNAVSDKWGRNTFAYMDLRFHTQRERAKQETRDSEHNCQGVQLVVDCNIKVSAPQCIYDEHVGYIYLTRTSLVAHYQLSCEPSWVSNWLWLSSFACDSLECSSPPKRERENEADQCPVLCICYPGPAAGHKRICLWRWWRGKSGSNWVQMNQCE